MLNLVEILNTPIGIIMMIILGFILTGAFQFPLGILIVIYSLIAVFVVVFVNSDQGSEQLSKKRKKDGQAYLDRQEQRSNEAARQAEEEIRQAEQEEAIRQQSAKAYEELLDIERTPLKNLQTNLAETAIEELAKVNARLTVSVILKDFPSVVAPAVFAVNQFESSGDFNVSEYLSENVKLTCLLYQVLQECFQLKLGWVSAGANFNGVINPNTNLGKLIRSLLPQQPKDWAGNYEYAQTTQSIMSEVSNNLIKLNGFLQLMRQISEKAKISNSNSLITDDPFEKIAKLKKLKDDGIITESEFESKKKDLIDRL